MSVESTATLLVTIRIKITILSFTAVYTLGCGLFPSETLRLTSIINRCRYSPKNRRTWPWSVSNSSPVRVFQLFFWIDQLLNNFRLNDRAIFHRSIFNADPQAPSHVTLCLHLMLFGCTRAICELNGIYNV